MGYRLLREDVEVLNRVIQDNAGHGDTSHGVGHIDAGVREIACSKHNLFILNILSYFHYPSGGSRLPVWRGVFRLTK